MNPGMIVILEVALMNCKACLIIPDLKKVKCDYENVKVRNNCVVSVVDCYPSYIHQKKTPE